MVPRRPSIGRRLPIQNARLDRQLLRIAAMTVATRLLNQRGWNFEIWSHAFSSQGRQFLMCARVQQANRLQAHPILVIEVSPAPRGLTPRTFLRPNPLMQIARPQRNQMRDEREAA